MSSPSIVRFRQEAGRVKKYRRRRQLNAYGESLWEGICDRGNKPDQVLTVRISCST